MPLQLFAHPFSSYCQKALIAFYENDIPFEFRLLSPEEPANGEAFAGLWPIRRFPILVDGARTILEASIIIEYLQRHHPGPVRLIPEDPDGAIEARTLDRVFDNYVMTPQGKCVSDALRAPGERDPKGVADARAMLETAYAWLDARMAGREGAAGEAFGLAARLFGDSNEKLIASLQRIEGALDKSLLRSDEQLAYYVAQAREVIDLSIMSQKQVMDGLQQLSGSQALVAGEGV